MKTTKKGFTLIELIVVIAIIGVLAAILVPAMIGYVRQSKIRTADEAATSVKNGINAGLTDLQGGKYKVTFNGWADFSTIQTAQSGSAATTLATAAELGAQLKDYVKEYFSDIDDVEGAYFIKEGTCIGVVASVDGNYWGSYPTGAITSKDYKTGKPMADPTKAKAQKCLADSDSADDITYTAS